MIKLGYYHEVKLRSEGKDEDCRIEFNIDRFPLAEDMYHAIGNDMVLTNERMQNLIQIVQGYKFPANLPTGQEHGSWPIGYAGVRVGYLTITRHKLWVSPPPVQYPRDAIDAG